MPAISVCNSPLVPAEEFCDTVLQPSSLSDFAGGFVTYGAAYLIGLLTVMVVLRSRSYRRSTEANLGISVSIVLGIVAAVVTVGLLLDVISDLPGFSEWLTWLFVLIVMLSLAYWLRSLRMGAAGFLCARWYAALCCSTWFSFWFVNELANHDAGYYGLWLSLAGSLLMLIAATAEVRIRVVLELPGALWALLRCRLELFDLDGRRCIRCGYLLQGLQTPRCPECGTPFDPQGPPDATNVTT